MDRDAALVAAREHPIGSASSSLSRAGLGFDPDGTRFADFLPIFLTHVRNRWKPATVANAVRLGQRLCDYFGSRAVATINRTEVVAWFESLTGSTIWPLSLLSSVMEHAEHLGLRPPGSNPCRGLRRKKSRFSGQPLTPEQYAVLGRALTSPPSESDRARALIQFLALTGARRGEATDLRWCDIHEDRAVLPDSKTGPKTVWLCIAVRNLLASVPHQPASPFVFRDDDRERFVRTVNATWQEIRNAADLGPHAGRARAVTGHSQRQIPSGLGSKAAGRLSKVFPKRSGEVRLA
ncbi:MAG: tyrosine-type recombinase/integrase [Pirellulaceae bacterium]